LDPEKVNNRIIKGVLFDFDGTLTRPGALDFPAIKRELGCPVDKPILEYLDVLPQAKKSMLEEILKRREDEAAETSAPNKGAEKCLLTLKKKKIPLGLITRNSLVSVEIALENFNYVTLKDFKAVITRENSIPKPHPDGVYKAAEAMDMSPEQLLVVGDFRFDIMAGSAAGSHTVLLTNGGTSVMESSDPKPDYIVQELSELLGIL
jgi:HAD superfamily hydrolase (TIGR01509 family)